tara:strand:- start:5323 stop:6150 length:828 start_codon:yes stop_codon:yes gene_type:complete
MDSVNWKECPVILPYWGGKVQLSRQLVGMIPPHNRYIEVFAGGLSMFFRKKKCKHNVINDKDNDIVNLYESVRTDFEEFSHHFKYLIKSRELFNRFKAVVKSDKNINIPNPKRAAEYYYIIKCAFNNNFHNPISKDQEWNIKFLKDINYSKQYFDNVMIENFDFRELLKRYPPKPDDFWYLDPPYIAATERKDYYFFTFNQQDHKDMLGILRAIDEKGGKFMVSYDDRNEIETLLREFEISKVQTKYGGRHFDPSKVYNELVITNYKPQKQETLF